MTNLPLARAAVFTLVLASPAFAADMAPLAPAAPFAQRFTWTGCYLGGHVGGGFARKDMTDPVQLAQDTFGGATTAITTTSTNPTGAVVGGQIGCDYQFAQSWVVGIEGSASGSTMKGSKTVPLRDSPPDSALVTARTDFLASVTGRLGYAMDNVLVYAKGGVAWAGDKYDVSGTFTNLAATSFLFQGPDTRVGWTAGAGLQWAFSRHWSASLEYDYYDFGNRSVLMTEQLTGAGTGVLDIKQTVQVVKLGLNFHVWASDR
jgi:outer membrane immunogenic protein